jgi:hypothetical protein
MNLKLKKYLKYRFNLIKKILTKSKSWDLNSASKIIKKN